MTSLVLDTNALIFFFARGADHSVFARYDQLVIPAAVDAEFRAGLDVATKRGRALTREYEDFLRDDAVVFAAADEAVAKKYAEIFRYLKKAGKPIPSNDMWIAATALSRNMPLCTTDAHFNAIPLLEIEAIRGE